MKRQRYSACLSACECVSVCMWVCVCVCLGDMQASQLKRSSAALIQTNLTSSRLTNQYNTHTNTPQSNQPTTPTHPILPQHSTAEQTRPHHTSILHLLPMRSFSLHGISDARLLLCHCRCLEQHRPSNASAAHINHQHAHTYMQQAEAASWPQRGKDTQGEGAEGHWEFW